MFARRLILCLAMCFGFSQFAGAAPACGGVDNVLRTVSILRDVQADSSDRYFSENMSELETTLSQISLPALQPAAYTEAFPQDGLALSLYISDLREAVSQAARGDRSEAKNILNKPISSDLSNSLGSMNRYWGCSETETFNAVNTSGSVKTTFENEAGSASSGARKESLSEPTSVAASSGQTAPARTLSKSISNGPKLDIKGHPILSIAMVLSILALIYGGRKYSKRSRLRDHRHLIHQDTGFKIGKKHYQMTIIDITQRGLKFKHDGLIQRQRKVGIELNGDWYVCRLVWKNANFAGAKFRSPLKEKTIEALLTTAQQQGRASPA